MKIQLLHVPDCPLTDQLHARLSECVGHAGVSVEVEQREGVYPSPTLLINGLDAATGHALSGDALASDACCRLDLPAHDQIIAALRSGVRD